MEVNLRRYEPSDWNAVCDIFNRSKKDEMKGTVPPEAVVPLEQDEFLSRLFHDSTVVVAEAEGTVLGFVGYKGSLLSYLFVNPDLYRKGIGSVLFELVLPELGEGAWLCVAKNNTAARALYHKFGFKVAEEFTGPYNGYDVEVLRLAVRPELQSWKQPMPEVE